MKEARKIHTCNLVETGSGAKKIVVLGGSGRVPVPMDSVEIFDISANKWTNGKKILFSQNGCIIEKVIPTFHSF